MTTHDPIRLCALADLVLIQCDLLRTPAQARSAMADLRGNMPQMLQAAGLAPGGPAATSLGKAIDLAVQAPAGEWTAEYHRLFEGATVCPLNETAYVRRDKGAVIGDLCGFYRAFGFAPELTTGEKADHLVTELEFLSGLLVMLAQAAGEQRQITQDALAKYCQEHMGDWIPSVASHLGMVAGTPFYVAAAQALDCVWAYLLKELNLAVPAAPIHSPQAEPEEPNKCIVPTIRGETQSL
jgi:TorA maturation chaperone TorD